MRQATHHHHLQASGEPAILHESTREQRGVYVWWPPRRVNPSIHGGVHGLSIADHRRRNQGEANNQSPPPSFQQHHRHGHPETHLRHKKGDVGVLPGGGQARSTPNNKRQTIITAGEATDERGEAPATDEGGEGGPPLGGGAGGAVAVGGGAAGAALQGGGAGGAVGGDRPGNAGGAAGPRGGAARSRPRRRLPRPRGVPLGGRRPGRRRRCLCCWWVGCVCGV